MVDMLHRLLEIIAHLLRVLDHALLEEHLYCCRRNGAGESVASEGGAVVSGSDVVHDVVVAEDG